MSADDDSFHPLGSEWEAELEEKLEESDYDADLGLEMAKDAQRLVSGELTEAEFHDRYHDAVVDEFGVDDRPTEAAWEAESAGDDSGLLESLPGIDGDESRREVMKKMGAGAAFLGLGAWATTDDGSEPASPSVASEDGDNDTQWGMVIDLDRCDGCLSCVTACSQENDTSDGANWMYVFSFEDRQNTGRQRLVRPCQHCSDAPCEKVCPTTARHTRAKDGLVLTDYDICIGCRYCQVACPYGVNYFQWGHPDVPFDEVPDDHTHDERGQWVDSRPPRGVMGKCTMCPTRQDGAMGSDMVGTTACEDACPTDAIIFDDMNDPDSETNQYLDDIGAFEDHDGFGDSPDDLDEDDQYRSTFHLLENMGTNPNITYIGNQPGPNAEQVDGPVSYDDVGEVDDRKDVLDEQTDGGVFYS